MDFFTKLTGRVDRRNPRSEGSPQDVWWRENLLSRDNILQTVKGTTRVINNQMTGIPTWMGRYYTFETGIESPKTFSYTQDGKLWKIDTLAEGAVELRSDLNPNAYPKHWLFKKQTQTLMYFVDGKKLYKHDGNNDDLFEVVTLEDSDEKDVNPIDIIEHRDRSWVISSAYLFVSKNLDFDDFSDATDSLQIIIGSGRGRNLAINKIEDRLYIFNTEGIFVVVGDEISALATTFEIRLVDERKISAGRSAVKVNQAVIFLAEDLNLYSWNGSVSTKISHLEKLEDTINPKRDFLNKAVAVFEDDYYKLSFVENGSTYNNLEAWWDTFPNSSGGNNIDFVRGRNVSCYLDVDPTREEDYYQFGRADIYMIMWANREWSFDGVAITVRLWTKDLTPKVGHNVRFSDFYFKIQPTGDRTILVKYFLDGRMSNLDENIDWTQWMRGEHKVLGELTLRNQNQVTHTAKPRIKYARGESISFYITDSTKDMRIEILGLGFDVISKFDKKNNLIGA